MTGQSKPKQYTELGRCSRATVYLEPELYELVQKLANEEDMTFSTFMRKLLMGDLLNKNLLPAPLLKQLLGA